jgi:hypothetical protein
MKRVQMTDGSRHDRIAEMHSYHLHFCILGTKPRQVSPRSQVLATTKWLEVKRQL